MMKNEIDIVDVCVYAELVF